MPSFLSPSSNAPRAQDNDWVLWQRWAAALYATVGNKPMAQYPEGTQPLVTDSEERLAAKVARMLNP